MHLTSIFQFALLATLARALPVSRNVELGVSISGHQLPNPICYDSGLYPSLCIDDHEVSEREVVERQLPNSICYDSGLDPSLCIDDRELVEPEVVERQLPNPICYDSSLNPSLCIDDRAVSEETDSNGDPTGNGAH